MSCQAGHKVLFEDGLVGRGDVALESFLSDLVSQVMDSRDLALLGNGLAIGVRSVCFHGVDPSCPARGAVAAAGPALFAVGVVVERFRVAVECGLEYTCGGAQQGGKLFFELEIHVCGVAVC